MVSGSVLGERVFSEIKRLCCCGLDETTLLGEVIERLRRVVPFDAYCNSRLAPLSGLITRSVYERMGGEKEARFFLEHLYFEDEISDFNRLVRDRRPVVLLSEATGGRIERALRYREFTGPLGLGYELRGVSTVGQELWGGWDLSRERGRPDFDACEVALVRRISPHLGAGLKAAVLRSQATSEPNGAGVPGMLVLDHHGQVLHYSASAEHWLRELEDLAPRWQEGNGLPVAVWTVVGALRRALKPQTERDRAIIPRVCVRARSGRWLTLQAERGESHTGQPDGTMILIEPAGPREAAWLNATAYGLSSREEEVAKLIVGGASTKQISQTLYITEYTVQNHLQNVFEKVGVRSRRALVKRLFFDNLYPTLFDQESPKGHSSHAV